MNKQTIKDVDLSGQVVLVRVDFNVPLENGVITDDTRITAALPTLRALAGSKLVLCSHLGRPEGKRNPEESLAPCAARLGEVLDKEVPFIDDCVGPKVAAAVAAMKDGDVILLENTRFYPGEESKDKDTMLAFAKELAAPAQAFVNDAFGSSHRKHASVYGVTHFLSPNVAGLLVELEVKKLEQLYRAPGEGLVVVLGGKKVKDKIGVIKSLLPRCEKMLIGGAMTWAFFKARGLEVGASYCKDEDVEKAREIDAEMADHLAKMILPVDVNMQNVAGDHSNKVAPADGILPGWDAQDIGPETARQFAEIVRAAKTVFWNGPMGHFELKPFDQGTLEVAKAMGECPGFNVVGGGDSVAAVTQMELEDKIDHVSTGGGASLEFLENGSLPGVDALDDK
ncbi:MAG: phosphoglycerate kinase [Armatimonadetes bacterium]|nr:phosphoglycerate kinase [Armatimonadota bacterium]